MDRGWDILDRPARGGDPLLPRLAGVKMSSRCRSAPPGAYRGWVGRSRVSAWTFDKKAEQEAREHPPVKLPTSAPANQKGQGTPTVPSALKSETKSKSQPRPVQSPVAIVPPITRQGDHSNFNNGTVLGDMKTEDNRKYVVPQGLKPVVCFGSLRHG